MYRRFGKRLFDILAASAAIVVLSPLLLLVSLCIVIEDGRPVIYRQRRIGRSGRPFTLLKFRSMGTETPELPSASGTDLRVTRVGMFIRRLNIDELPQLFNILRGEMSVVGPRPALPVQEDVLASRRANGAAACVPGLTGLAQISSYDGMPPEAKARFDGLYAEEISLGADVRIIFGTFKYLLRPPPRY